MELKLMSWNVNGIRAVIKNGFTDMLLIERPDVIGLQEIKISHESRGKESASRRIDFPGYKEYWFPAKRAGYSGTAILTKKEPLSYKEGIGVEEFDKEGRVQIMEFADFYFVNAYFPNSGSELARLKYKIEFNAAFLKYVKKIEKHKPVVLCGDMNVAHEEIDLAHPKDNERSAGFTKPERADMTKFLDSGLIDTFRLIHEDKVQYSWWSYRTFARDRGIGWRIDYFLVSEKLKKNIKKAFIKDDIVGSDHCPVGIILKF